MSMVKQSFHRDILQLDAESVTEQITQKLREDVFQVLRKRGGVVGLSGGIDSAVTFGLMVRALGANRVLGVIMPERESSPESEAYARLLIDEFGADMVVEDLTAALEGLGCYTRTGAVKRPPNGIDHCDFSCPSTALEAFPLRLASCR